MWSVFKENINLNEKESSVDSHKQRILGSIHNVQYYLDEFSHIRSCNISSVFSVGCVSVQEVYSVILSLSNSASLDVGPILN